MTESAENYVETTHMLPPIRKGIRVNRIIERPMLFAVHDWQMISHAQQVLNSPQFDLESSAWSFTLIPPVAAEDVLTIQLHNMSGRTLTASLTGSATISFECHPVVAHEHEREEFEALPEDAVSVPNAFCCTAQQVEEEETIVLPSRITKEMLANCGDLSLSVQVIVYGDVQMVTCPSVSPEALPEKGPTLGQDISRLLCIEFSQHFEVVNDVPLGGRQKIVTNIVHSHEGADDGAPGTELHGQMCDIELVCNSVIIHAHKAILAARSPVFHKKLTKWSTSVSLFFSKRYRMDGVRPGVLIAFITFLYTDVVSSSDLAQYAFPLLILAGKYQVAALMCHCELYLANGLMTDCAANYLLLAKRLKLHAFAVMCEDFIAQNLSEVRELDPAYARLDATSLSHLLDKANANAFLSRSTASSIDNIPEAKAEAEAEAETLQQRGKVSQAKRRPRPRTDTDTQVLPTAAEKQRLANAKLTSEGEGALEAAQKEELTARERAAFTGEQKGRQTLPTLVKKFEKEITRVESKQAEKELERRPEDTD